MKTIRKIPNFLLLQVIDPHTHSDDALTNMSELADLVGTYGGKIRKKTVQHRVKPDSATYIGRGKLSELKTLVKDLEIDVVVLNGIVNSGQVFRLEKSLWEVNTEIKVWDRIDLILNIFELHAKSREAKLQIELARLEHQGPRIFGLGGTVLSRQGAGIGTRGLGETNIEKERRLLKDRKAKILKDLGQLKKKQRKRLQGRKEKGLKTVALIGYTSAGKTTLFNALSGKERKTHGSLFTTLDSVVGRLVPRDRAGAILISDTIGFIEDLPPTLINTFRSTLMETVEAQVLLHVIDASDNGMEHKIQVVDVVLNELEIGVQPILVFNKIDLLNTRQVETLKANYTGNNIHLVSAKTGVGVQALRQKLQLLLK